MNKKDIKIGDILYWNTTGPYYGNEISLKCEVLDVGKKYIWVMVFGNLSPTPLEKSKLSVRPLHKVTNIGGNSL